MLGWGAPGLAPGLAPADGFEADAVLASATERPASGRSCAMSSNMVFAALVQTTLPGCAGSDLKGTVVNTMLVGAM